MCRNFEEPLNEGLFGSSVLPAHILIGTREVQLGEIVRRAFADCGVTAEEWNAIDPFNRDILIVAAVHDLREEVALAVSC